MSGKGGFIIPDFLDKKPNHPVSKWSICSSCMGKGVINCHPAIGTCGRCHGLGKVPKSDFDYGLIKF